MTELRRAVAYAAGRLGLSHDTALLLPVRVVIDLWEAREREEERERLNAAGVAANEATEDRINGHHDDRPDRYPRHRGLRGNR